MALTVDGVQVPAHVQAQGNAAIEAYVQEMKQIGGIPHPLPKLAQGETKASRDASLAPQLAQIAEHQAKAQAEAEKIIVTKVAPIVLGAENPPPVARAQHRAQAAPKTGETSVPATPTPPVPEPPAK